MYIQNQLKLSGTAAHTIANQAANMSVNSIQIPWNKLRLSSNIFVKPTICPKCGYGWSISHHQNCPGRGKSCKNCAIANHFAEVCRKTKVKMKPKSSVNIVDDTSYEAGTIGTSARAGEQ